MKFSVTKTYFAILLYTKRADDIGDNPAQNVTLFSDLCHHFKLKKNERGNFRTNLYFAWKYDRNDLKTKVIKQLKSTQDNSEKATEDLQAKVQLSNTEQELTDASDVCNDTGELIQQ